MEQLLLYIQIKSNTLRFPSSLANVLNLTDTLSQWTAENSEKPAGKLNQSTKSKGPHAPTNRGS